MKIIIILSILVVFFNCDNLEKSASQNWSKRIEKMEGTASLDDIKNWEEKLSLDEEEVKELEKEIYQLVRKERLAGALAWKIARAFMKVGKYEKGIYYYNESITTLAKEKKTAREIEAEVHYFERAIPYFEKALLYKPMDEELLFETGLAYANASRDRGWEKSRRNNAVKIFTSLAKRNPEESKYRYQLALIYFDSSLSDESWEGLEKEGYDDVDRAFDLLDGILSKEKDNLSARFAKANFLFRVGRKSESLGEYKKIKSSIEYLRSINVIKEDLKDYSSYQKVLKNIQSLEKSL